MKTSELTGALLNYWVAMAGEEWNHVDTSNTLTLDPSYKAVRLVTYSDGSQAAIFVPNNPMRQDPRDFDPAGDWAQGGPIIDRERIYFEPSNYERDGKVFAYVDVNRDIIGGEYGETRLVAAMRAYVASRFGDTVPDEVQS